MERKKINCTLSYKIDYEKLEYLAKQSVETFVDFESKCIQEVDIEACIRDWISVVMITHDIYTVEVVK